MRASARLALAALAIVLIAASYARLARLGAAEFDQDDFDMYYAAQSVAAGHGPLLPSGQPYVRGADVTRLAAITQRHASSPEEGARLPSAIAGVLGVLLFALVAWSIAGPWASVLGTALLAMDPELVFQSRSARFYTYQALFGIVAFYAGWRVVEEMGAAHSPDAGTLRRRWAWAIVTLASLAMAARAQVTTLSILAGWATVVLVAAVLDLRARGRRAYRDSVPLQLALAGIAVLAVALLAFAVRGVPAAARDAWTMVRHVPTWAGGAPGSPLAYYYTLSDRFPLVIALAPASFLIVILRRPRLGLYLALWFAVPLMLHSFVLAWKAQRYILLALPALFLATGTAGAIVLGVFHRAIESRLRAQTRYAPAWAAATTACVTAFALVTMPAFSMVRKSIDTKLPGYSPGWRAGAAVLHGIPGADTLPLGSTSPLAALRYWGRVNFTVQRGLEDNALGIEPDTRGSDGVLRDFYAGVPILLTPAQIDAYFRGHSAVLIGVDSMSAAFGNVDTSLVNALHRQGTELCRGRCGAMRLYRLPLPSAP